MAGGQYFKKPLKNYYWKDKKRGQYVSRAVVTDAPVVIQKGIVSGVYSWRLQSACDDHLSKR